MWGRNSRSSSDSTCGSPSKALSRSSNPNRTCSRKGQYACTSVRSQLVAPRNVRSQASTASVARDRSTPATNRRGLSAGNPAMDALCGEPGTTSSGTAVERIRRSATPPRNSRAGPRRPWVPTTRARVPCPFGVIEQDLLGKTGERFPADGDPLPAQALGQERQPSRRLLLQVQRQHRTRHRKLRDNGGRRFASHARAPVRLPDAWPAPPPGSPRPPRAAKSPSHRSVS